MSQVEGMLIAGICVCVYADESHGCRAVVLKVENGLLADAEQGDLRTNELTPFNMALHPQDQTLVIGVGSAGLQVISVVQQSGSAPQLKMAPGKHLIPLLVCTGSVSCSRASNNHSLRW